MTILITGGTGFLGVALAKALIREGHNVVLFDVAPDYEETKDILCKVKVVEGDLTRWMDIVDAVKKYKVKDIFHLGATLTTLAEKRPFLALDVNLYGTINVLEAARLFNVGKVVYASTVATYGPDLPQPVDEGSQQQPRTVYGLTKLFAELWGLYYHYRYGVDFRALRFASLVGGKPARAKVRASAYATLMAWKSALGEPYEVDVDENQRVQILYYKDAVDALILLYKAESPKSRIYNVGGVSPTARELADTICKHIPNARIRFVPKPETKALLSWPTVSSEKIKEELGWKMSYPLDAMVKDFIEEVRARNLK